MNKNITTAHGSTEKKTKLFQKSKRFTTKSGLQITVGSDNDYAIRITGLHDQVSAEDIREIMQRFGSVNYAYILYRDDGKHSGTAKVCFAQKESAVQASKELEGVLIDSKPVDVQYLGAKGSVAKARKNLSTRSGPTPQREKETVPDRSSSESDEEMEDRQQISRNGKNKKVYGLANSSTRKKSVRNLPPEIADNPLSR